MLTADLAFSEALYQRSGLRRPWAVRLRTYSLAGGEARRWHVCRSSVYLLDGDVLAPHDYADVFAQLQKGERRWRR